MLYQSFHFQDLTESRQKSPSPGISRLKFASSADGVFFFTMRPVVIKGHSRPLTQLKFNREGDIFFSTGRDGLVNVFFSENGKRIGTFSHTGAAYSVDVDPTTTFAVSSSADMRVFIWMVQTGQTTFSMETKSTPRFVELSPDAKQLLVVVEEQMGQQGSVVIYNLDTSDLANPQVEEVKRIVRKESPFVKACWTYDGKHIVAIHRNGTVSKINAESGETEKENKIHEELIVDLQLSKDRTYFVTSSRDKTAHLCYVDDLEIRKTYVGDVPFNSAAITPVKDYIIAGGGIDAKSVTTSSDGRFEVHFFHKLFEDDLGRLGGHFGPINTITVHPHGTCYVSGSEDGYVRLNHFDPSYFEFSYGITSA